MLKRFTTKELILIALVSALSVAFAYAFGVLNIITGIPLLAAVNGLFSVILATFLYLTIKKFGTIIIYFLIHGILIIPGPAMGPPGIYKPIVLLIIALVTETILIIGERKVRVAIPIAMSLGLVLVPVLTYLIASAMGIPNMEKTLSVLLPMTLTALVFGLIGGWLGLKLHDKLKNKKIFRQM